MEKFAAYVELLNLPDLAITDLTITPNRIDICCALTKEKPSCPHCGSICTKINDRTTRKLRDLNISGREVYLLITLRQFLCLKCGSCPTEKVGFADPNKSYTHRQAKYVFELCKKQSYKEIGAIVNMHPKTVERLVLEICKNNLHMPERYARLKRLGIDEQSHRKGKKNFICLLTNLDTGEIVDLLPNRRKETLIAHFKQLGEPFCQQITDVSCDIWSPYISTIETCFPQSTLILDRFHVTKLLNESLNLVRKQLRKDFKDQLAYKKLKWIIFKQYHLLSDDELDELEKAFILAPQLQEYYFLREDFHHILDNQTDVNLAIVALDNWVEQIHQKQIVVFDTFCKTLKHYKRYVANYVKNKLSNAVTEGLNNLVRSIRRCSFGMPNFENIRLRVLAISG